MINYTHYLRISLIKWMIEALSGYLIVEVHEVEVLRRIHFPNILSSTSVSIRDRILLSFHRQRKISINYIEDVRFKILECDMVGTRRCSKNNQCLIWSPVVL